MGKGWWFHKKFFGYHLKQTIVVTRNFSFTTLTWIEYFKNEVARLQRIELTLSSHTKCQTVQITCSFTWCESIAFVPKIS